MTTGDQKPYRCPAIFAITAIIALFVLGLNGQGFGATVGFSLSNVLLPLISFVAVLAFLGHYFTDARLPNSVMVTWVLRLFVWVAVVAIVRLADDTFSDPSDPRSFAVIGCVVASEMVIQCWRPVPARLSLLFCAGIVYLSGCYQDEHNIVPLLTPAFFLMLILSWRALAGGSFSVLRNRFAGVIYVVAIAAALLAGFGGYQLINVNKANLNVYAQKLLENQNVPSAAGMSDSPQLSSVFGQQGSPERILLIQGALPDPHLRAASFSSYNDGGWGPALTSRSFVRVSHGIGAYNSADKTVKVSKIRYTDGYVYYPLDADFVSVDRAAGGEWSAPESGPLGIHVAPPSSYTFTVSDSTVDTIDKSPSSASLRADLVVPASIARAVVNLSKKICARSLTDSAKIDEICGWLDSHHGYSLDYISPPGDPVSEFVLGSGSAHCEYFASSAVIMMRSVGIPARYVIGYYAHESDIDGETVVRQRDAHAWAEAYVNGTWETVDATPAGGRPDKLYEESVWGRLVENIEDRIQLLQDKARKLGPGKVVATAAIVIIAYFILRLAFREFFSRRSRQLKKAATDYEFAAYAERFNRILKKWGISVPSNMTWREYFDSDRQITLDLELTLQFIDYYNALRFGLEGDKERLSELLDTMERLEKVKEKV